MKLIFFAFKHRYRYKDLNNFLHSRFYGKYFLINLGGPFKHFIAKVLLRLNWGFAISCDARPLIKKKKQGINFFIRGTNLNIPLKYSTLENNYVSIKNPFKKENNIFQVFPVNIKKFKVINKRRIVFIGGSKIDTISSDLDLWKKYKSEVFKDFTIIDNNKFWKKILKKKDYKNFYNYYKQFKILLRLQLIKYIKKKFSSKFILIGDDWKNHSIDSLPSNYDLKFTKKIYEGNICLDFGSLEGSSSLYTRSNQIIESGGLLLQNRQSDHKYIWKNLSKKISFNNFKNLYDLTNRLLNNDILCNELFKEISKNFSKDKRLTEKNLDFIFKKSLR